MKSLKLDHQLAQAVLRGEKNSTWRINDEKNLSVNDEIEFIDKVDPSKQDSWQAIGGGVITRVVQKRLGDITKSDMAGHGLYTSTQEIIKGFQQFYGPDVTEQTAVKMIHFDFIPYPAPQAVHLAKASISYVKLYTDGGSRGNPGMSASGYVLMDRDDAILKKSGIYLGITTNNQAEYQALRLGLEEAYHIGAREVDVFMDSLLVVNQMNGVFKIKNRELWPIHQSIKELLKLFHKVRFMHIPRELNRLADAEVNDVLDAEESAKHV